MKYLRSIPIFIFAVISAPEIVALLFRNTPFLNTLSYAQTASEFTLRIIMKLLLLAWIMIHLSNGETLALYKENTKLSLSHFLEFTYLASISFIFGIGIVFTLLGGLLYLGFQLPSFLDSKEQLPIFFSILNASMSFIIVVFITPILEEYVFRGLILKKLSSKYTMRSAVLFSVLIFAMLHTEPLQAFLGGLLLTNVYLRYKDMKCNILLHMLMNLPVALSAFIPSSESSIYNFILTTDQQLQLLSIGIVLFLVFGGLSVHFLMKHRVTVGKFRT